MPHLKILQNACHYDFLQRKMEYHTLDMEQEFEAKSSTPELSFLTTSLKIFQLNAA